MLQSRIRGKRSRREETCENGYIFVTNSRAPWKMLDCKEKKRVAPFRGICRSVRLLKRRKDSENRQKRRGGFRHQKSFPGSQEYTE